MVTVEAEELRVDCATACLEMPPGTNAAARPRPATRTQMPERMLKVGTQNGIKGWKGV